MAKFNLFEGPDYQPYLIEGGERAALLVHGFPGTPAELRPLGEVLYQAGWTVQGMLVPGFGTEFSSIHQCQAADWQAAVEKALMDLREKYPVTLLVGYSMGGGLCLHVAARCQPTGLILLAPFWQIGGWFWASLPVLTRLFPKIRPFRILRSDWLGAETRRGLTNLLPEVDLDDPQTRKILADIEFPTRVLIALRQVGNDARQAAPEIKTPVLVLQGARDRTVRPADTRELLQILPGPSSYIELPAAHDLTHPESPAWPELKRAILSFAAQISATKVS